MMHDAILTDHHMSLNTGQELAELMAPTSNTARFSRAAVALV